MSRLAVFGYGSLVSRGSAELTLGRPVPPLVPARLEGWTRRWTLARDNNACEKTFARSGDGTLPDFCLGLNLEADPGAPPPNGALLEVSPAELERLDLREMRYRRLEVAETVRTASGEPHGFDRILAYRARPEHHHPTPPPDCVLVASYLRAVEAAFAELGPGELELFRATTEVPPVDVVEADLVLDSIPPGNPRGW